MNQKSLIQQYISFLEGPFAAEKIVDVLEGFDNELAEKPAINVAGYLTGKTQAMWRRIKREYNASFNMDKGNRQERFEYLNHIFPDIDLREIESRIENFQSILNRFKDIHARRVTKGIFEVVTTD